jgi:stress-induced morphogen
MSEVMRPPKDKAVRQMKAVLDEFERDHKGAKASLYRQNGGSVRIRVVDKAFSRLSKGDRHDLVWGYLADRLPEDVLQEISVLLLLAPTERKSSFMNLEFDDPIPSKL